MEQKRQNSSVVVSNDHKFETPVKKIINQSDVRLFHQSNAYRILLDWIKVLNASVVQIPNSAECHESDVSYYHLWDPSASLTS